MNILTLIFNKNHNVNSLSAFCICRYVIESGKFEVTKRGHGKLNECGVGQTFGELALLYGAKRSATVSCIQDASLWALDRQTFR
jgi:cGMP-dependent protein kinase 1